MTTEAPKGAFILQPEYTYPVDPPYHEKYKEARRELIDRHFCSSKKYQDQQWRAMRIGAHPDMLKFTIKFIAKLRRLGIPAFASEIVRTAERQRQLYAAGYSNAVGAKAPHPYGCASDIIHSKLGWKLSKKQWEFYGELGKELAKQIAIPIVWGGDWPPIVENVGWDPAHWQLKHWRQEMSGFPFMPPPQGYYK